MSFILLIYKKLTIAQSSCAGRSWLLLSPSSLHPSPSTPDPSDMYVDQTYTPFAPSYGVSSTFSLELVNPSFNNDYAIATNVDPSIGSKSVQIPTVPVRYVMHSHYVSALFLIYHLVPTMSTMLSSPTYPIFILRPTYCYWRTYL